MFGLELVVAGAVAARATVRARVGLSRPSSSVSVRVALYSENKYCR